MCAAAPCHCQGRVSHSSNSVHLLLDRYAVVQIAQGLHGIGIEPRLMLVLLELLPNQSLKGADFTLLRRASTAEACAGLNAATASSPSRMQLQSKQGLKLREGIHLCHRLSALGGAAQISMCSTPRGQGGKYLWLICFPAPVK